MLRCAFVQLTKVLTGPQKMDRFLWKALRHSVRLHLLIPRGVVNNAAKDGHDFVHHMLGMSGPESWSNVPRL